MKRQIGILMIVSTLIGIGLFYPQRQVDALPGLGGTINGECAIYTCVTNCLEVGVEVAKEPIAVVIDAGANYVKDTGTQRSCGDAWWKYCSWDWGCRIN